MGNKLFLLENIKDNQCIDFLIGSFHQFKNKNFKLIISMGPLNRAYLYRSKTFKKFLLIQNIKLIPSYKIKERKNIIFYFFLKITYYVLFFLSILLIKSDFNLKIIEKIWERYSSKLEYQNIDSLFEVILIPWRKPSKSLNSYIKGLNKKAKEKLLLIPHSPLYDESGFKDDNQNLIFKGIKRIYPHRNYDLKDTYKKKVSSIIEPNYKYLEVNKFINKKNKNNKKKLKILYLSQKLSRVRINSKRKFTYQVLSKTRKNIQEILLSLDQCSIVDFEFKIRIPLHMCRGNISYKDFENYPIKVISNGLLIDDIIAADIILSEYTSAMIYALNCRPTYIISSEKLEYFFKSDLNINKILKQHLNSIVNSINKENMNKLIKKAKYL